MDDSLQLDYDYVRGRPDPTHHSVEYFSDLVQDISGDHSVATKFTGRF